MSSTTRYFSIAMILCCFLVTLDWLGTAEFGSFVNGLVVLVITFAILAFNSLLKDRKANNG